MLAGDRSNRQLSSGLGQTRLQRNREPRASELFSRGESSGSIARDISLAENSHLPAHSRLADGQASSNRQGLFLGSVGLCQSTRATRTLEYFSCSNSRPGAHGERQRRQSYHCEAVEKEISISSLKLKRYAAPIVKRHPSPLPHYAQS
jgi:hypothetical protein